LNLPTRTVGTEPVRTKRIKTVCNKTNQNKTVWFVKGKFENGFGEEEEEGKIKTV
jgi:hypothetical protein